MIYSAWLSGCLLLRQKVWPLLDFVWVFIMFCLFGLQVTAKCLPHLMLCKYNWVSFLNSPSFHSFFHHFTLLKSVFILQCMVNTQWFLFSVMCGSYWEQTFLFNSVVLLSKKAIKECLIWGWFYHCGLIYNVFFVCFISYTVCFPWLPRCSSLGRRGMVNNLNLPLSQSISFLLTVHERQWLRCTANCFHE